MICWYACVTVTTVCEDTVSVTQALAFYISTSGTGLSEEVTKAKSDPNVNDGLG